MRSRVLRWLKRAALLLGAIAITLIAVRIYDTQRGPPLELWHTYAPPELSADEIDEADWSQYLAAEQAAFEAVRREVDEQLDPEDRVPVNRYFEGSPVHPARFAQDWNRSYVLEPEGAPVGAVVFLHGLTDSPYSQRHIAQPLSRPWLRRDRDQAARPWHRSRRSGGGRVGGLAGRHAARRARGAPAHRPVAAAAPGRVLQRRRARHEVCLGRDRGPAV